LKAEVLILDDHANYLRVLRSAAETRGFKVIGTESSTGAALQTCSRVQPDVIVVDLHLDTDSDGYSFCKLLKEINGPARIVITSPFTGRDTVQRAFAAGADRCIRKPFRMEEALRLFEHLADELEPANS
jgi:DNA-binding NarL/FixJ family response regulator